MLPADKGNPACMLSPPRFVVRVVNGVNCIHFSLVITFSDPYRFLKHKQRNFNKGNWSREEKWLFEPPLEPFYKHGPIPQSADVRLIVVTFISSRLFSVLRNFFTLYEIQHGTPQYTLSIYNFLSTSVRQM